MWKLNIEFQISEKKKTIGKIQRTKIEKKRNEKIPQIGYSHPWLIFNGERLLRRGRMGNVDGQTLFFAQHLQQFVHVGFIFAKEGDHIVHRQSILHVFTHFCVFYVQLVIMKKKGQINSENNNSLTFLKKSDNTIDSWHLEFLWPETMVIRRQTDCGISKRQATFSLCYEIEK